jgi:anthraniloyl-CoA monooxygenase
MRILCCGGGPASLYFGLLMKKHFPEVEIEIHEKNKADDTFGWGVVFSKETLGNFIAADEPSYKHIEARFAYWDDIETHKNGIVTTSTGHGFCGLARKELLLILQNRCRELGVKLHFESELNATALPHADIVVASDGIHSPIREAFKNEFKPRIDMRQAKFTWLGSTAKLKAFTFIFKNTPHGLFQVHAYPFAQSPMAPSGALSTFIVECHEDVWKKAGLDVMTESDSVAYLSTLFEAELKGERLLPNKSIWRTFPNISCEKWSHKNMILLGDSCHTAHFSIGSGTKLAMEDSIALVESFRKYGISNDTLAKYESERKTDVIRVQKAAQTSLEWFENAARYTAQSPLQFTFNLMTRSKRITWNNLRERDPKLVAAVDEEFATAHASTRNSDYSAPPPLFAPLRVGGIVLPNRVVVSPMCQYSANEGLINDWHLVHLGSRATGGAGLVFTEMTDVSAQGRITHGCAGIYTDAHTQAWKRVVDFVHHHSASKIGIQLAHAGRKGSCQLPWEGDSYLKDNERPWTTLAPSGIPFKKGWHVPKEMSQEDMALVCDEFVQGTKRAVEAGFDVLELHMAHGYLLSSFLSPLSNQRADGFGGTVENRMKFPLQVFSAVRAVWPKEKALFVRVSATDWLGDEGQTVSDTVLFAQKLKALGCDMVDVSSAGNVPESAVEYGRMYQVPFAEAVKYGAEIKVMAVGGIAGADHVNTILASGRADLCALARAHLSDAQLTQRHAQDEMVDTTVWPKQYLAVAPRRKSQKNK